MMFIYGFVFLLYLSGAQGSADVFELDAESTWIDAINRTDCNIATPSITPGENGFPYNLTGGKAWVGYYRTKVIFNYLGCLTNEELNPEFSYNKNSVGLCYSRCRRKGYQVVGVNKYKCYCVDVHVESIVNFNCQTTGENVIDVYKVYLQKYNLPRVNTWNKCPDGSKDCLRIDRAGNTTFATWSNCNCHLKTICLNDNHTTFIDGKYGKWIESAKRSLSVCQSTISLEDIMKINTTNIDAAWSGVTRDFVIFKYDDDFTANHTPIKYGLLRKRDDGLVVLNFQKHASAYMSILCKNSHSTTTTIPTSTTTGHSTTTTIPTSTTKASTAYTTRTTNTLPTSKSSTVSTPPMTSTLPTAKSSKAATVTSAGQSSNTGVIAGVVVSVIVVLVVIAMVVVVSLHRRQKLSNFCKWASKAKTGDDYQQNVTYSSDNFNRQPAEGFSNQVYNQVLARPEDKQTSDDDKSNHSVHGYHDNVAIGHPNLRNGLPYMCVYDNDVLDIAEPYDYVYNELKADDHVEKNTFGLKTDNDYDTFATAVEKLKAINDFDENGYDPYNHINAKPEISGHTDNIYGLAGRYRDENMATKDDMDDNDD